MCGRSRIIAMFGSLKVSPPLRPAALGTFRPKPCLLGTSPWLICRRESNHDGTIALHTETSQLLGGATRHWPVECAECQQKARRHSSEKKWVRLVARDWLP